MCLQIKAANMSGQPLCNHPGWAANPALMEADERDLGGLIPDMTPPGICLTEGALEAKNELDEAVRAATLVSWANALPVYGVAADDQITNPMVAIEVAKRYFDQWLRQRKTCIHSVFRGIRLTC